jgi:ABC-type transport system involved in cytochrome c biogenesis ATPase subunit
MEMILKTTNLCKSFSGQTVVNNISLNIERNSVYGLLGPNGAGKSTTLKMITGILKPTSGNIEFDGHTWKRSDLNHIGALIEMPPLYENLTAYENLKVRTTVLGLTDKRIDEVLQIVRLTETSKKTTSAEAAILRKEADLDLAKLNLSYTVLIAPYDGYMGRRTLEPGQYVQTGQTISYLVRNKDKWITANYKETQIANIYIGQQVRIKVDAVPGKIFHGEVTAISEATGSKYSLVPTDNSAGNFVKVQQRIPVRIELEDVSSEEMAQLRAGMMVETEALRK